MFKNVCVVCGQKGRGTNYITKHVKGDSWCACYVCHSKGYLTEYIQHFADIGRHVPRCPVARGQTFS